MFDKLAHCLPFSSHFNPWLVPGRLPSMALTRWHSCHCGGTYPTLWPNPLPHCQLRRQMLPPFSKAPPPSTAAGSPIQRGEGGEKTFRWVSFPFKVSCARFGAASTFLNTRIASGLPSTPYLCPVFYSGENLGHMFFVLWKVDSWGRLSCSSLIGKNIDILGVEPSHTLLQHVEESLSQIFNKAEWFLPELGWHVCKTSFYHPHCDYPQVDQLFLRPWTAHVPSASPLNGTAKVFLRKYRFPKSKICGI